MHGNSWWFSTNRGVSLRSLYVNCELGPDPDLLSYFVCMCVYNSND